MVVSFKGPLGSFPHSPLSTSKLKMPWPRPLESLPALSCDEKGGAELPAGWQQRHAAQSGAFGNYAWQVETRPEEDRYVGIESKRSPLVGLFVTVDMWSGRTW